MSGKKGENMTTQENLKEAFAGESMANRKYLAFAEKAEQEGYKSEAKLFRAAAAAETVHALNHLRVMGGVSSTANNVKNAIDGETVEFRDMYPRFIEAAKKEKASDAATQWKETHLRSVRSAMLRKRCSGR